MHIPEGRGGCRWDVLYIGYLSFNIENCCLFCSSYFVVLLLIVITIARSIFFGYHVLSSSGH